MSDDTSDRWRLIGPAALFALIALLIAADLVMDRGEGAGFLHIAVESFALLVAATGAALLLRQFSRVRSDLTVARSEANQWREANRELVLGLGAAIQNQFTLWELTAAEAEIGLFLLKGLSHKEIADLRQTSERTVREQSRALYRKAGLSGRSALSAFFLEDLLPGMAPSTDAGSSGHHVSQVS